MERTDMTKTTQSAMVVDAGCSKVSLLDIRADKDKFPRLNAYYKFNEEIKAYDWTTEAKMKMAQIVMRAFMYKGASAEENNVRYISVALLQEMHEDAEELGLMNLTFEEIDRSVKRAVLGQGKEMFGISVSSIYYAITDYCRGEGHRICEELGKRRNAERMRSLNNQLQNIPAVQAYARCLAEKK